jgi:hypothetical protein
MFRFSIGPEKREFTMHRASVARLSPALAALVNNTNFKEAREGHVVLEEVEEQTFIDFLQYAYTEDYDEEAPTTAPVPTSTSRNNGGLRINKHFVAQENAAEGKRRQAKRHAKIYVFADYYGITNLMNLALCRLDLALQYVVKELKKEPDTAKEDPNTAKEREAEGFIALLRYCYDNAMPERLRSFVVLQTDVVVEELWMRKSFVELLEEHGELSTALIGALVKGRKQEKDKAQTCELGIWKGLVHCDKCNHDWTVSDACPVCFSDWRDMGLIPSCRHFY